MGLIEVDNLEDDRLAVFRHLKATNATRDSGLFVLEGEKLLGRLLDCPRFELESVVLTADRAGDWHNRLPVETPVYVLPESKISQLVGFPFHLGVVSAARRAPWPAATLFLRSIFERTSRLTLAVCPAVNDPENLGAIARIGDCFGIDGILAGPGCPDPLSRRVLRVSMGAVLRLPIWVQPNLFGAVDALQSRLPLELVACVSQPDHTPLDAFRRAPALALVLGNEAQGLAPEWLARCDRQVTIPMRPGADSLNVAVAAGIVMYQATRT